jgi:hypothetical protein
MIVMSVASGPVAIFIADHPKIKMLVLAFLLLIGMALVAEGFRLPYSERVYLFCDGTRRSYRSLQCAGSPQSSRRDTLRVRSILLGLSSGQGSTA